MSKGDRRVPLEDGQRAEEVPRFAAPAAADLEMLPVDLVMRVDGRRADVRVVAGNHVSPADSREVETLGNGGGRAGRLEDGVRPFAVRGIHDGLTPLFE